MPTPPFSQNRRDWLDEVLGLIVRKPKKSTVEFTIPVPNLLIDNGASAKNQAVVNRPGRAG
jgi:hypothetical protein